MLAGSHHMGRVDHFLMGGQSGADPGRVEMAKKFGCQHLHVEMEPGDALFFHSNLLHTRSRMGRDLASNFLTILYLSGTTFQRPEQEQHAPLGDDFKLQPGEARAEIFFFSRRGTVLRSPITVLSTSLFIKFQIMR